jgi:hypothetical protein
MRSLTGINKAIKCKRMNSCLRKNISGKGSECNESSNCAVGKHFITKGGSMYNDTGTKKTMLISPEQDSRLKAYCKRNRISASQLFRLMIDELSVSQYDLSLKDNIQTTAMALDSFVSPNKAIVKETLNDGNGNIRQRWYNPRREFHNTFPHANHV